MEFKRHLIGTTAVAELVDQGQVIAEAGDALDLLASAGTIHLVVHESQLHPDFFRLRTGLAGEILQKCSNYGRRLAVVGDFGKYSSPPLKDFMYESNRTGNVVFAGSVEEALDRFQAPIRP